MHNSNRVHFPDSAEKRPSRLHTQLMHFKEVKCQVIYNRTLTNSHLPHNRGHGFRKIVYPAGVSQLSPSQALTVNQGIDLLPGRPDQSRNPGSQNISTMVKQVQQSRPMRRQIPIGAAHISFLGQHRMRLATSKTNPQVALRWPRRQLSSDQHLDKHWPGGAKIKMTLGLADPRERYRWW